MLSLVVLGLAAAASAANIDVVVGAGGQLVYKPAEITAAQGDTVTFHFGGGAHSVSQSSVDAPCAELAGGFDSGFANITALGAPQTWTLTINDVSKPIWFYCKQGNHCQSGMAGAINAPAGKLDAYITAAKAVPLVKQASSLVQQGVGASAASGFAADTSSPAASNSGGAAPTGTGSGAAPTGGSGSSPTGSDTGASPSSTAPPDNAAVSQRAASAGAVALAVMGAAAMVL